MFNDLDKYISDNCINKFDTIKLFEAAIMFAETKKRDVERREVIFTQLSELLGMQREQGICIKLDKLKGYRLKPYKTSLRWFQLKPLLIHLSKFETWDKNEKYRNTSIPSDYKWKHLV